MNTQQAVNAAARPFGRHRKTIWLAGAAALSMSLGAPAFAQAADDAGDEVIVVTGSRIARPNLEQPTPVATVDVETIESAGTSNLGDIIAQLPALSFNGTVRANSDSFGDAGGLNFPDLRDLGTARTLTLVDGLRHVAGDAGDSAVDLNSIPPALVQRVEVVTGGASAIYGSDAVSGVINIITRRDFEGVAADILYSAPEDGGYNENMAANLTFGRNFLEDRANITVSLFYDTTSQTRYRDLEASRDWGAVINSPGPDGIPDVFLAPHIVSEFIDERGVLFDAAALIGGSSLGPVAGFLPDGTPVAQPPRIGDNSFAFGQFAGPCDTCFSVDDWVLISPDVERRGIAGSFDLEFTPNVRFHFDGKFISTEVEDYVQPAFSFFEYVLDPDNAFITPAIQQAIDDYTAANPGAFLFVNRFLADVGPRANDITRETARIVTGVEGDLGPGVGNLQWRFNYVWGQTENEIRSSGDRIPGNYLAAIDAVVDPGDGQIRCRMDVPATWYPGYTPPDPATLTGEPCVPYNPFGLQNSAAALDYVTYNGVRTHTITQDVITGSVNFDTSNFLNLPGGPIDVAAGFEWREETSENINDEFVKSGLGEAAPQPDATGGFDVTEFFFETHLPLISDRPFFDELSLDAAVRFADYSTVGDATSYRIGAVWGPIPSFRFRGVYSSATRAPNITEAFLPVTSTFFDVDDPCDQASVGDDPDRLANCNALGITQPFVSNTNVSPMGTISGNAALDAEESTSWSLGIVFEPDFIDGLAITLDYYNIEIDDAITLPDPQDILDNCVDASGGLDPTYCDLVTRDPTTRDITFIEEIYLNASRLKTAGYDLTITYRNNVADWTRGGFLAWMTGDFTAQLNATYVENLRLFPFQTDPASQNIEEGEIGSPRVKLLSRFAYEQGPLLLGWEARFISRSRRYDAEDPIGAEAQAPNMTEPAWFHDVNARLRLGEDGHFEIYGGVNNLFDDDGPVGSLNAAYDIYGRTYFLGARARF